MALLGTTYNGGDLQDAVNGSDTRRNITAFGVSLNVVADQSAALQSAFDSGLALYFPAGIVYLSNTVVIPSGLNLQGAGPAKSYFQALAGATADMFNIAPGQIRYLTLRDFGLLGLPANATQRGMVLAAAADGGGNGGVWEAVFENIRFRGFNGISMAWLGLATVGIAPHQWVKLTMIDVERPLTTSDLGLYMHGQCEHFHFDSCRFDGNGAGTSTYDGKNIYVGRSFAASDGLVGSYGTGTPLSDIAPKTVKFSNLTCQAADQAIIVDRAENIDFDSSWFEDNHNTLLTQNQARVSVRNGRWANAASTVTTGKCIRANSSSQVVMEGSQYLVGTNTIAWSTDGSGSVRPSGSQGTATVQDNVEWSRTITSATTQLDMGVNPGILLTASTTGVNIAQIASSIAPGEMFSLKNAGATNPFDLVNTGSGVLGINLGVGVAAITVAVGETVLLRKSQIGGGKGWNLVCKI